MERATPQPSRCPAESALNLISAEFAKQWNPGWREDVRRPGCVLFFAVSSRDTCGRNFSQDGRRWLRVAAGSGRWILGERYAIF